MSDTGEDDAGTKSDDICGDTCPECYRPCGKERYHYATPLNPHVCEGPSEHEWVR